mgnify:CR=1 FL=1
MSPILCFGEALLDLLPIGAAPGGAPMNVAYHLHQFGTQAAIVTRLGADAHGQLLRQFFAEKHLDTSHVQTDEHLPTGTVHVRVTNDEPSYTIVENVAWDAIAPVTVLKNTPLLVHGSLALRSTQNQQSLRALLTSTQARVVFDVNFRAPFYSKSLIEEWLDNAHMAKLNEHELAEMLPWFECSDVGNLLQVFPQLELLIVTKGGAGAEVLSRTERVSHSGFRVQVADTVGSGDAFLAAFIHYYLKGESLAHTLEKACAMGAFVASCKGATPSYKPAEIFRQFGI